MMRILLLGFYFLGMFGCNHYSHTPEATIINLNFIPFYQGKVYLEKLQITEGKMQLIDSAELNYETSKLNFRIAKTEESVFQIRIKDEDPRIYFVNDSAVIDIQLTPDWRQYSFRNKGINNQLMKLQVTRENCLQFSDTVRSPGAFLFVYNRIDFGQEKVLLKKFISSGAKRFPFHSQIATLKIKVDEYLSILEEEYKAGDQLPGISLLNDKNEVVNFKPGAGKFVFIDFWSSWCRSCIEFIEVKKKLERRFADKLVLINIALDPEKEAWQNLIEQQNIPGIHFIDTGMWTGTVANIYKIDSVPFNFLVNKDGRIIYKAIKSDSVLTIVSKELTNKLKPVDDRTY